MLVLLWWLRELGCSVEARSANAHADSISALQSAEKAWRAKAINMARAQSRVELATGPSPPGTVRSWNETLVIVDNIHPTDNKTDVERVAKAAKGRVQCVCWV